MATILNADTVSGGAVVTGDSSGEIQLQGGGTPRLTFNTSGAMGVGSSPSYGTSGQVLTSAGTGGAPTWAAAASPFSTGDVKTSVDTTSYTAPDWLPCDSASYSNSTYPSLAAKLPTTDFTFESIQNFNISAVTYVNGVYVASGRGIWTSPDAVTWTQRVAFTAYTAYGASGNGSSTIVVPAQNGVYTSTDNGVTWTFYYIAGESFRWSAFGATRFVVTATSGTSYYSSNGTSWTSITGSPGACQAMKFVGSAFILCNSNASGSIWYSTDGITFTQSGPANITFYGIAFGGSTYVVVGNAGAVYTATSLGSWTSRSAGSTTFNDVKYGATSGQFVAVGNDNGTKTVIYSSPTGVTWTLTSSSLTLADALQVATDGTNYVVVTNNSVYYTSSNGTTWTNNLNANLITSVSPTGSPKTLEYSNSKWLLLNGYTVFTSTNSTTWTATLNSINEYVFYSPGTAFFKSKIASNGTITVIPSYNGVITTTDNVTFTYRGFNNIGASTVSTNDIAYNGTTTFVAITNSGTVPSYSSTDGISWTASGTTISDTPNSLATNGSGTWVMGTQSNNVYYSTNNGSTWTQVTISGVSNTFHVEYLNGYFRVSGNGASIFSTNGITWTSTSGDIVGSAGNGSIVVNNIMFISTTAGNGFFGIQNPTSNGFQCAFQGSTPNVIYDIAYGNGVYVAVGAPGTSTGPGQIWYSTDGYTFFIAQTPSTGINNNPITGCVSYLNGKFYAFASDNSLYTSTNGINWTITRMKAERISNIMTAITYVGSRYALLGSNSLAKESTTTFRTPFVPISVPAFIKT